MHWTPLLPHSHPLGPPFQSSWPLLHCGYLTVPAFLCYLSEVAQPYSCMCRHGGVKELTHQASLDQWETKASEKLPPLLTLKPTNSEASSRFKPSFPQVASLITQPGGKEDWLSLLPCFTVRTLVL